MAMKDLVDPNCGGPNALMKVTSHFTHDKALQQENLIRRKLGVDPTLEARPFTNVLDEDLLVKDFLTQQHARTYAAPQTIRMDSLLQEMQAIEQMSFPTVQGPTVAEIATSQDWATDFLSTEFKTADNSEEFSQQFAAEVAQVEAPNSEILWAEQYLDNSALEMSNAWTEAYKGNNAWAEEYKKHENAWAEEFKDDNTLEAAARDFVDNVKDPKLTSTEFMKFVKRLGDGGLIGGIPNSEDEQWAQEFNNEGPKPNPDTLTENISKKDFWDKLEKEWEQLSKDGSGDHPWLSDFEEISDPYKEYKMNSENPLLDHPDPLSEGLRLLKEGDIPSAVLLFESAAQKNPENPLVWQYLGATQAENENDNMAIAALKKCVELQPDNLTALMTLAVSYTNESFQVQACHTLQQWLKANPKYSHLVQSELSDPPKLGIMSLLNSSLHEAVCNEFMTAARLFPSHPDPDVQCGLGVLFNLSSDYDKAVDCFKAALQVKPEDSHLWNKLGATLANGKRSEEAVEAYHRALQLSPGFIRSRYNLGISCINLKSYKESAEHFLTALNHQAAAKGIPGAYKNPSMSDSIWSTFRLLISLMERSDLYNVLDARDLDTLNREFGVKV